MTQTDRPANAIRWLPLVILGCLVAGAYALGLQNYLSLENIAGHRDVLRNYVGSHLIESIVIYAALYIVAVALSLPAAIFLSVAGGFMFGWAISVPVSVISATIGAVIVFQIVKTSIGRTIAERAGPFVKNLSKGFSANAFNYLLFLRLVPAFPFFVVNAVAGVCQVNIRTFIAATFLGIMPGAIVFAWIGRGLDSIIDAQLAAHEACVAKDGLYSCHYKLSVSALITWQLLFALCALGVLALIPIAFKKWKAQS